MLVPSIESVAGAVLVVGFLALTGMRITRLVRRLLRESGRRETMLGKIRDLIRVIGALPAAFAAVFSTDLASQATNPVVSTVAGLTDALVFPARRSETRAVPFINQVGSFNWATGSCSLVSVELRSSSLAGARS